MNDLREISKHHPTVEVINRDGEATERIGVLCSCGETLTSAFTKLSLNDINQAVTMHLVNLKPRKRVIT